MIFVFYFDRGNFQLILKMGKKTVVVLRGKAMGNQQDTIK